MVDTQAFVLANGWQAAGLLGAIVYIGNYLLIATDRINSSNPLFYIGQLIAALLVLVSLAQQFNPAAVVIQTFFILVSLLGLLRHVRPRRAQPGLTAVQA